MSKLKAKFGKIKQKVADQVDELQGDLSRLKVAAAVSAGCASLDHTRVYRMHADLDGCNAIPWPVVRTVHLQSQSSP